MLQEYPSSNEGGQKRKDDQIPHSGTHLCLLLSFRCFLFDFLQTLLLGSEFHKQTLLLMRGFIFEGRELMIFCGLRMRLHLMRLLSNDYNQ
jgi:hypothetical protein